MARPTAMDEYFVHQIPELLPGVAVYHHHWRESYFYELHDPSGDGDAVFFTMAHYPAQERMDSLQMGRVAGRPLLGVKGRPYGEDPHTPVVHGARVDVEPFVPVLRGMLFTGEEPRFMRSDVASADPDISVAWYPLWWPPTKIAGINQSGVRATR